MSVIKRRFNKDLFNHPKRLKCKKKTKINIFKKFLRHNIPLNKYYFPFAFYYSKLSKTDRLKLDKFDTNDLSYKLERFIQKFDINSKNYKNLIKNKNITHFSFEYNKKAIDWLFDLSTNLDIINSLIDFEAFNTEDSKILRKNATELMADIIRSSKEILYTIIYSNYNFIDKTTFQTIVITSFILSAKIILQYDLAYDCGNNFIKDLIITLDVTKGISTVKNVVKMEVELLKSTGWVGSYKVQKRLGLLPYFKNNLKNIFK